MVEGAVDAEGAVVVAVVVVVEEEEEEEEDHMGMLQYTGMPAIF